MPDFSEQSEFAPVPYVVDGEPVNGGVDGVANRAPKGLVNRTRWLKDQLAALTASLADLYARKDGDYSTLRARATTKEDVELGNVGNYPISETSTGYATDVYASSKAVRNLRDSLTEKIDALLPAGMVVMWHGQPEDVPAGWVLLNGAGNLPDYRNSVPVGAGDKYGLNETVGHDIRSTGSAGAHTPQVTVGPKTLSIDQMPSHTHALNGIAYDDDGDIDGAFSLGATDRDGDAPGRNKLQNTGGGNQHGHPASAAPVAGHVHGIDVRQRSRGVYFIMKV